MTCPRCGKATDRHVRCYRPSASALAMNVAITHELICTRCLAAWAASPPLLLPHHPVYGTAFMPISGKGWQGWMKPQ